MTQFQKLKYGKDLNWNNPGKRLHNILRFLMLRIWVAQRRKKNLKSQRKEMQYGATPFSYRYNVSFSEKKKKTLNTRGKSARQYLICGVIVCLYVCACCLA